MLGSSCHNAHWTTAVASSQVEHVRIATEGSPGAIRFYIRKPSVSWPPNENPMNVPIWMARLLFSFQLANLLILVSPQQEKNSLIDMMSCSCSLKQLCLDDVLCCSNRCFATRLVCLEQRQDSSRDSSLQWRRRAHCLSCSLLCSTFALLPCNLHAAGWHRHLCDVAGTFAETHPIIESSKSIDIGIYYGLSFLWNAESPRNLQQTKAEKVRNLESAGDSDKFQDAP